MDSVGKVLCSLKAQYGEFLRGIPWYPPTRDHSPLLALEYAKPSYQNAHNWESSCILQIVYIQFRTIKPT